MTMAGVIFASALGAVFAYLFWEEFIVPVREQRASVDTRRMAETGNTDSVRSTGGAVPSEAQADAQTSPKEYP